MLHGHDPRDVREWPWKDVELMIQMHHLFYGGVE